jgi:hypothetical protein
MGGQSRVREIVVHVLSHVEYVDHNLVCGEEVVGIEGVDDALFGMARGSVAGYTPQHEHAHVVRVDGCGAINQLASCIIVIKRLPLEVDVVGQGLTMALLSMRLSKSERERAKDRPSNLSHRISEAVVAQSGRASDTHLTA